MRWSEVRAANREQWLIIEALAAHSENGRRVFDQIAVIEACADGPSTLQRYGELRRHFPHREFWFVHTGASELDIEDRRWLGIRGISAVDAMR